MKCKFHLKFTYNLFSLSYFTFFVNMCWCLYSTTVIQHELTEVKMTRYYFLSTVNLHIGRQLLNKNEFRKNVLKFFFTILNKKKNWIFHNSSMTNLARFAGFFSHYSGLIPESRKEKAKMHHLHLTSVKKSVSWLLLCLQLCWSCDVVKINRLFPLIHFHIVLL